MYKDDLESVLKQIARVTKKYVILEIKNKNNLYTKYIDKKTEFPHYFTTKGYVKNMLSKYNFALKKTKPIFFIESISPIIIMLFEKEND